MSKVINLIEYKKSNYRYVTVYFNAKEEDYWINNYCKNPRYVKPPTKEQGWELIYEGLLSNEEIRVVEEGQPLSIEYGMFKSLC